MLWRVHPIGSGADPRTTIPGVPAPTPSRTGSPPRLSRRAALTALAAGVSATVAGCSTGTGRADAARSAAPSAPAPRPAGVSPDVAVAVAAVDRITAVAAELARATRGRRGRVARRRLAGLAALHAAHLRILRQAVPADHRDDAHGPTGTQAGRTRGQRPTPASVARSEGRLRVQLEDLAVRAESGEFARLLAAMSAAIGQQLVVMPA